MALNEYNLNVGVNDPTGVAWTQTVTAVSGGATSLGGTTAIRLLVDDAVTPSKTETVRLLYSLINYITQDTWTPS